MTLLSPLRSHIVTEREQRLRVRVQRSLSSLAQTPHWHALPPTVRKSLGDLLRDCAQIEKI
jgi:hypothetical protein